VQIGLLGPFEVRLDQGAPADVPGPRLRALLAALALEAGRTVPKAALIDWIWGEHPPTDASNALQRLASRLRRALPPGTVEGRPEGYRLAVDPEAVDAVRFERLARGAPGEARPQRRRRLREALALWRGTALQDIGLPDSPALDAAAACLNPARDAPRRPDAGSKTKRPVVAGLRLEPEGRGVRSGLAPTVRRDR
jgi:two-component SAPR family response regulator